MKSRTSPGREKWGNFQMVLTAHDMKSERTVYQHSGCKREIPLTGCTEPTVTVSTPEIPCQMTRCYGDSQRLPEQTEHRSHLLVQHHHEGSADECKFSAVWEPGTSCRTTDKLATTVASGASLCLQISARLYQLKSMYSLLICEMR